MPQRKYTKEVLEEAVKNSRCFKDVVRYLIGETNSGGMHSLVKRRILEYEIDTSHFQKSGFNTGKSPVNKHTFESFTDSVLIKDGPGWSSHGIKIKIFDFGIKEKKCELCGQDEDWNGCELKFDLHHINGNHYDNRIENLQILCPNCHSIQ